MFMVAHKNEFEMLEMYVDDYPLFKFRKKILFVMKFNFKKILFLD